MKLCPYSREEEYRRAVLASKLDWAAYHAAQKLIASGAFDGWSRDRLTARYAQIFDELCPSEREAITASSHVRIDDPYLQFLETYGAEVRAIGILLQRRSVSA